MSDYYYFPDEFKCMYCKVDISHDDTLPLGLPSDGSIDLRCPQCGALWKFWVSVQLQHKLLQGGKYNKTKTTIHEPISQSA